MHRLFETAKRRGVQVSRVRIKDKNGDRFIFFLRDAKGRILHNGQSFDSEEMKRLFPDCEAPTTI
jgi:hypothetical protein